MESNTEFVRRIRWMIKDLELGRQPVHQWMDKEDALDACDRIEQQQMCIQNLVDVCKQAKVTIQPSQLVSGKDADEAIDLIDKVVTDAEELIK